MGRLLSILAGLALLPALPAFASFTTYDDLLSPAEGLVHLGVTYGFTVGGLSSSDINYGGAGPGTLTYVNDPSLEGDAASELTLDFAGGATVLSFGVALDSFSSLAPGFSVQLFNGLNLAGSFGIATDPLISASEGLFQYSGSLISRAVVTFDSANAGRFALDNLNFDVTVSGVPEPSTSVLSMFGLIAAAGLVRRRS